MEYSPGVRVIAQLIEAKGLTIMGSPTHLSKTLMNLVSNAVEAMPRKGGRIIVSTDQCYMDRPVAGYDHINEGDYVTLSIADTGTGISPNDIDKIFEPFYTRKKMGRSGTGLGMAVVWGTVKDHKGFIDVQSREGEGTTFKLYFPVTREASVVETSKVPVIDYAGGGEQILVIDDVEQQREVAAGMLKQLGYEVSSVSSGEEAIEFLKDHKVDLLLLDMIMDPGMDGLETYRKGQIEMYPGQRAVIASGFSETDRVRNAQLLGAGTYIKKPFSHGKAVHGYQGGIGPKSAIIEFRHLVTFPGGGEPSESPRLYGYREYPSACGARHRNCSGSGTQASAVLLSALRFSLPCCGSRRIPGRHVFVPMKRIVNSCHILCHTGSFYAESGLKLKNYGENRSCFQRQKFKPLSFNTRLRNDF